MKTKAIVFTLFMLLIGANAQSNNDTILKTNTRYKSWCTHQKLSDIVMGGSLLSLFLVPAAYPITVPLTTAHLIDWLILEYRKKIFLKKLKIQKR